MAVCGLRMYSAVPVSGARCGCVCFGPPTLPFGVRFFLALWRVVSWLCGVCRWLSRSWVSWCPSPLPLSLGLRFRVFFVCFFRPSVVCVGVLGVSSLPVGRCSRFGVASVWLGGPPVPLGVPSSVPSGLGVWSPFPAWVGGLVAVGLSRAPPPPCFFLRGGGCLFLPLPLLG